MTSFSVWLVAGAISLHNLEEALWLPAWSRAAGRFHPPVDAFPFRFAVLVLTALAVGIAAWASLAGPRSLGMTLLAAYALAMAINVAVPHLAATVALGRYCPGLATGVLAILPACGWFLVGALRSGAVTTLGLAVALAVLAPGLLLAIPSLFRLGAALEAALRSG